MMRSTGFGPVFGRLIGEADIARVTVNSSILFEILPVGHNYEQ
jgi:hypothetical protein